MLTLVRLMLLPSRAVAAIVRGVAVARTAFGRKG